MALHRFASGALSALLLAGAARAAAPLPYGAQVFRAAGNSLPRYIGQCLAEREACGTDETEGRLLEAIARDIPRETNLAFVSPEESPDFFEKSAASPHRIAITG